MLARNPGGQNGEKTRLPGIQTKPGFKGFSQVFPGAEIVKVACLRKTNCKIDRLLEVLVATGLLQILAHLIVDVPFEGVQPC